MTYKLKIYSSKSLVSYRNVIFVYQKSAKISAGPRRLTRVLFDMMYKIIILHALINSSKFSKQSVICFSTVAYVSRIHMSQFIRSEMLSIFLCYFVTLSVYPGVLSDLVSPRFGTWMPVLVMTVFNTFDLVGKVKTKKS